MTTQTTEEKGGTILQTFEEGTHNCMICNDNGDLAGKEGLCHIEKEPVSETSQEIEKSCEDKPIDVNDRDTLLWYAMRDLTRPNALNPAYKMLDDKGFEVFTPKEKRVRNVRGKRILEEVPVIHDLLFVHSTRNELDPVEAATPTLRYRYVKGGKYKQATIVRDADMDRFQKAVGNLRVLRYYSASEIKSEMMGRVVKVHGGPLDGREVQLRKLRGTKKKRIFVEIPDFIVAEVELTDYDYLELPKDGR